MCSINPYPNYFITIVHYMQVKSVLSRGQTAFCGRPTKKNGRKRSGLAREWLIAGAHSKSWMFYLYIEDYVICNYIHRKECACGKMNTFNKPTIRIHTDPTTRAGFCLFVWMYMYTSGCNIS